MTEGLAAHQSVADQRENTGSPLSYAQERLWLAYLLEPRSPVYNIPVCLWLRGEVDIQLLERSLTEIVRRHDILRTRIVVVDEEPLQKAVPPSTVRLAVTDLDDVPVDRRRERAMEWVARESARPFDLRRGPVFRASLTRTGETEQVFLFVVHHIAFDGWSRDIFLQELCSLYEGFREGATNDLPDLPLTYADFAAWQRESGESPAIRDGLAYWRGLLGEEPQVLDLPTDYPRPVARTSVGHTTRFQISPSVADRLIPLARSESTTLYVTLLAAFVSLLHRYTGQDDIVIGHVVAGRTRSDLEGLMGFFVNTIPLRARIDGDASFRELVRHVRSVVMGSLVHQDVPLEKLTEELHLAHDLGRPPLFQSLFTLETFSRGPATVADIEIEMIDVYTETAKFDLTLIMRESPGGLLATWEYSTELFEEETVQRMAAHFARLLEYAAGHSDARLSELPLLGEDEHRRMLIEWNSTEREYPRESCVHELFEEQAGAGGTRIALVAGEERMTYAELNESANRLARRLRKEGVDREVPVGICLNRSLDMIVGILAILKAGGAYVPLDPEFPLERLQYMLDDTGAPVVVTDSSLAASVPADSVRVLCLDVEREQIAAESGRNLRVGGQADDLAYIMYTSGSTGKPKGVCVVHRGVVRLVRNNYYASLGPDEVMLQLAKCSFDASTFEIWGSLLNGGRLVIFPDVLPTNDELGRVIRDEHVSTLWLTAGLFHNVVDAGLEALSGLKQLLAGGDVVSPTHAAQFKARYPDCRLINGYGPTENTTFTTSYEITGTETGPLPIGRPIANTTAYILDAHLHPVPVGVVGELCTGGDGLARGYLRDEELTGERFVPNTVTTFDSPLLYRTGDLARYRADGVILFEGRKDNQVKVNGFRVETDEVELALRSCPSVAQAAVVVRSSPQGDKQLVAYCVPRSGAELTAASLRACVQESLPGYMVPSSFVTLTELPLNPQGKVDRAALPDPGPAQKAEVTSHTAPRDPLESTIASIWQQLFATDSICIHDNFFDLGGHSLLAFRFFAALEKSTGAQLPLATLFEAPTVAQLADVVRQKGWQPRWSCIVPLKPEGSRPPVFFAHGVSGSPLHLRDLARSLHPDQPVFGLQARGLDGDTPPLQRLEDMAAQYIAEMMILQPHGPYALCGYSFGGILAFEIARQLIGSGEKVGLLALLDTFLVAESRRGRLENLAARARYHVRSLFMAAPKEKMEYIRRSAKSVNRKVRRRYLPEMLDEERPVDGPIPDEQRTVLDSNHLAARRYVARPYPGTATLFVAGDRAGWMADPAAKWTRLATGGVQVITVPGNHWTMASEPHVRVLARRLDECLNHAQLRTPTGEVVAPR